MTGVTAIRKGYLLVYEDQQLFLKRSPGLFCSRDGKDLQLSNYESSPSLSLTLSQCPSFVVIGIVLNSSGTFALLTGQHDVMVVTLPKSVWDLHSSEFSVTDFLCRCEYVGVTGYRYLTSQDSSSQHTSAIMKAAWHPGHVSDILITILRSDNTVYFYRATSPDVCVQKVNFQQQDLLRGSSVLPRSIRHSLGELAVSFDFGAPTDSGHAASDNGHFDQRIQKLWPLFLLCGNGDIYVLLTDPAGYSQLPLTGPLTLYPPADDNYGVDACSLLYISGLIPVLVIATEEGVLYHCIVLEDIDVVDSSSVSYWLFVYESVKLDLFGAADIAPNESSSGSNTLLLCADVSLSMRYFCRHRAGVYGISLPWLFDFSEIVAAGDNFNESHLLSVDKPAVVEHIVCTQPVSTRSYEMLRGMCIDFDTLSKPLLIVLLSNGTYECFELSYATAYGLYPAAADKSMDNGFSSASESRPGREYFVDHIKKILRKDVSNPVLKLSRSQSISAQQMYKILLHATTILREEYIDKLTVAKHECDQRVSELDRLKLDQQRNLDTVRSQWVEMKSAISETQSKLRSAASNQRQLLERLERILSHSRQLKNSSAISKEESSVLEELKKLQLTTSGMQKQVNKLQERSAILLAQPPALATKPIDSSSLQHSVPKMKEQLSQQNITLECLVTELKVMQDEILSFQM